MARASGRREGTELMAASATDLLPAAARGSGASFNVGRGAGRAGRHVRASKLVETLALVATLGLALAPATRIAHATETNATPPAPDASAAATPQPAPSSGSPGATAPLAGIILEDPDARAWDLSALAGHPVLLVVADRAASGESVEWGRRIGAARPQSVGAWIVPGKTAVVSVADLRAVPGFARGTARWIIAQMVGEQGAGGPPLLLDWDGVVAQRIGAHDGVPNVRLYASDGTLVLQDEGDATPERIARLAAAIDGLVPPSVSASADHAATSGGTATSVPAPATGATASDEAPAPATGDAR